ncbi:hypothetical protein [Pectinatus haikarae]|uniref:hypothetical protein n=1 Tax=Pectinatus haikarae TaxID=349096 RepID=UPI0018C75015|nr:hypothetical protein [Pectinatus haikarae]
MSDLYYIFNGIKNTMELVNSKRSGYDYLTVDGAYALLLPAYEASYTTKLWVSRDGGTTKKYIAIRQTFNVTISQSANQTITVICNGTSYTSSFTARYGDAFSVSIIGNNGYTAGGVNVSSGNVTGDITAYATSGATLVVAGSVTYASNQTASGQFIVPAHVNVLAVYSNAWSGSRNVAVTSGNQYLIRVSTQRKIGVDVYRETFVSIGNADLSKHTSDPNPLTITISWSDAVNTYGTGCSANYQSVWNSN